MSIITLSLWMISRAALIKVTSSNMLTYLAQIIMAPHAQKSKLLKSGKNAIKDVDVQGASQIRTAFPSAIRVFLASPSMEETERRLRGRGTDADDVVARRLAEARAELSHWREYDYVVINDSVDEAAKKVNAIIEAERCRPSRN